MEYSSREIKRQIDTAFLHAQTAKRALQSADIDASHRILFCAGVDESLAKLVGELESMLRVAEAFEAGAVPATRGE